ncbi:MAG: ABC transporter permease [Chloroflexi bacterium]|nr:ABC transporter permease [Chloroflexota bacterium]MBI2975410.1 ABC transporter permease [Chloroflexota bacterium]
MTQVASTPPAVAPLARWRQLVQPLVIPALAIFTALIVGSLVIVLTDLVVLAALKNIFAAPGAAFSAMWKAIITAYGSLFEGSIGSPTAIIAALRSGDQKALTQAFYPISDSLVTATPYIFAGLAVAVGFRCGLFNIGVEGQLFIGAICSVWVGFAFKGLPAIVHIPLALLAGAAGGAVWASIPAILKAKTGAHEVINTIMMNYIAFRLSDWLLGDKGPLKRPDSANPVSPFIEKSAELPRFFPDPIRFHIGFFIALAVAVLIYWILFKTTLGFEIRTVGANPSAAKYAGMNITRNLVIAMCISGALAGLAGANEVLGVNHNLAFAFSSGYGFDSIALALLGKSHPLGVVLAALLFGTLRSGATRMQNIAHIPIDIISIIQALIIAFIAAPAIIRALYRIKVAAEGEGTVFTRGWGK